MDDYIQISKINDFLFCPYSLYLHSIYENFDTAVYHGEYQIRGKIEHESIDVGKYSSAKKYLQGLSVYSEKYKLAGKIDIYDKELKALIERKYKINKIYDGQKYQLYAQYLCMKEMGYMVDKLYIHSLSDNKRFEIEKPSKEVLLKFESTIEKIRHFNSEHNFMNNFAVSSAKCKKCIYNNLCAYSNAES